MTIAIRVSSETERQLAALSVRLRRPVSEVVALLVSSACTEEDDDGSGAPAVPYSESVFTTP